MKIYEDSSRPANPLFNALPAGVFRLKHLAATVALKAIHIPNTLLVV